ncbi:MAG: acyl carrier protein [Nakamurella sp.]
MDEKQFILLVEQIVEVTPGTVALTDSLDEYDWDSLSVLNLIAALDTKLGITLDARKISSAGTPAELLALVNDATLT